MKSLVDLSRNLPFAYFLSGVMLATFAASGLFFYRFWKKSAERFFLYFALACWMIAFERLPLIFINPFGETQAWCYLIRVAAFVLIILAVVRANRAPNRPAGFG